MGNVFEISLESLNLLSFMLGMTFAFFQQGLFGKRMGKYVIFYFIGLAMYYGISYYVEKDMREKYEVQIQTETFIPVPK
jgi:hypothetical protein